MLHIYIACMTHILNYYTKIYFVSLMLTLLRYQTRFDLIDNDNQK